MSLLGVGSFKVAAGNVVEHQVTILESPEGDHLGWVCRLAPGGR